MGRGGGDASCLTAAGAGVAAATVAVGAGGAATRAVPVTCWPAAGLLGVVLPDALTGADLAGAALLDTVLPAAGFAEASFTAAGLAGIGSVTEILLAVSGLASAASLTEGASVSTATGFSAVFKISDAGILEA